MGFLGFNWGSSPKDSAFHNTYNNIKGMQLNSGNAFSKYKNPFAYDDKVKNLWTMQNQQIGDATRRNTEALAQQGITQGSAITAANDNVAGNIYDNFADKNLNLMGQENQDAFNLANAQNQEKNQAIQNQLAKYGLMLNAANGMDDSTGWDWLGGMFKGISGLAQGAGSVLGAL